MIDLSWNFQKRINSLKARAAILDTLKELVDLPPEYDFSPVQWEAINLQTSEAKKNILDFLKKAEEKYLPNLDRENEAKRFNRLLGKVELELNKAMAFFHTYLDAFSQRKMPEIQKITAGCDVIAKDAANLDFHLLKNMLPPVVFFDRGLGASIIRQGVVFYGVDMDPLVHNPLPLIQIPYSKLKEKYNLTSIIHEVGHEIALRLNLVRELEHAFTQKLEAHGAPSDVVRYYALCASEILPDFIAFCTSGFAQTAGIMENSSLPREYVQRVSFEDPHPASYLRVLMTIGWSRAAFGKGFWDNMEQEWKLLYSLKDAPIQSGRFLSSAEKYLPVVNDVLFNSRFFRLAGKTLPDAFDLDELNAGALKKAAGMVVSGKLDFFGLSPCAQLSVFRLIRESGSISDELLDIRMTEWLLNLPEESKKKQKRRLYRWEKTMM